MSNSKILVVDDEPFICRSRTFVLKKGNFDVLEARDGEEALASIREHKMIADSDPFHAFQASYTKKK